MKFKFVGATEGVTGSMTLVTLPEGRILIDCGMVQGSFDSTQVNALPFSFDPKSLSAVVLTHAHLDHSGLLPKLVKEGFTGRILCTKPTAKLIDVILTDSAELGDNLLYSVKDVQQTLRQVKLLDWNQSLPLFGGVVTLLPAGHILGASSVRIRSGGKSAIFSGDLGRTKDPLIPAPPSCEECDAVILESTYGGRVRTGDMEKELYSFLLRISRENRVGIIASFAVARAQLLLTLIGRFFERHPEDKIPLYYDSPMMDKANRVYDKFAALTKIPDELRNSLQAASAIQFPRQWESVAKKHGPLLVLSSSGMVTGGRIFRSLENWQNDSRALLFLPGFQAEGTFGYRLIHGERNFALPEGRSFSWMGEVMSSEAFSSHADQNELLSWVKTSRAKKVFLVHGEAGSKESLKEKLVDEGLDVVIPVKEWEFELWASY